MTSKYYYLFGEQASIVYKNNAHLEIGEYCLLIAKEIRNSGGAIFVYNESIDSPTDLLLEYDRWAGLVELTKKEYERIKQFIACI